MATAGSACARNGPHRPRHRIERNPAGAGARTLASSLSRYARRPPRYGLETGRECAALRLPLWLPLVCVMPSGHLPAKPEPEAGPVPASSARRKLNLNPMPRPRYADDKRGTRPGGRPARCSILPNIRAVDDEFCGLGTAQHRCSWHLLAPYSLAQIQLRDGSVTSWRPEARGRPARSVGRPRRRPGSAACEHAARTRRRSSCRWPRRPAAAAGRRRRRSPPGG